MDEGPGTVPAGCRDAPPPALPGLSTLLSADEDKRSTDGRVGRGDRVVPAVLAGREARQTPGCARDFWVPKELGRQQFLSSQMAL